MYKKYQIFISSTYEDLKEERDAVLNGILIIRQFPVGMEYFGASSRDQWDIIKRTIDETDYFILIIGFKYGTEISDGKYKGISYTEREYRYAKEKGIPILAFIEKSHDGISEEKRETDSHRMVKLDDFKADVMTHRMVDFWQSPGDLRTKVIASLHKEFEDIERPGWIRNGPARRVDDESQENSWCGSDMIIDVLQCSFAPLKFSQIVEETGLSQETVTDNLKLLMEKDIVKELRGDKYIYIDPDNPPDGEHVFRNEEGIIVKEGTWKDEELYNGKEYNWIILDENKTLKYNTETNDYDGDENTEIIPYAQYDADSFHMNQMDADLEYVGLDHFYVADFIRLDGKGEYVNLRKLEDFLEENKDHWLKQYRKYHR